MRLAAVIGANYGDEGKGRSVDHLIHGAVSPIVVRHNSSAQAGHTVVRDGLRHVHSHFGSGTLAGVPTLLTHKFVVNPRIFEQELAELLALKLSPKVYLNPNCAVTTPIEALLNQLMEFARGDQRHGSCGIGFGETIQRHGLNPITIGDWSDQHKPFLRQYFLNELKGRNFVVHETLCDVVEALKTDNFNWEPFDDAVNVVRDFATMTADLPTGFETVIFEGAQGLILHEASPDFPHVTRCRTGLEDVVEFLSMNAIEGELTPYYVTRTYLTRHGAGPLPNEALPHEVDANKFEDLTNQPNPFQGTLRFAPLISETLIERIHADLKRSRAESLKPVLMISCCDQLEPNRSLQQDWEHPILLGHGPNAVHTETWKRSGQGNKVKNKKRCDLCDSAGRCTYACDYALNNPEEVWDRQRVRDHCPLCERTFPIGAGALVNHCRNKHMPDLIDIAWTMLERPKGPLTTTQRLHAYGCLRTAYELAEFEQTPITEVTTEFLGIILDAISETH